MLFHSSRATASSTARSVGRHASKQRSSSSSSATTTASSNNKMKKNNNASDKSLLQQPQPRHTEATWESYGFSKNDVSPTHFYSLDRASDDNEQGVFLL